MVLISENLTYDLIAALITLFIGIMVYMKLKFSYWEKLGVPTLPPALPFGNLKDVILGHISFGEKFSELYTVFKSKGNRFGGVYLGATPIFIPTDIELIKHIMQIDFAHFPGHGGYMNEEHDPLSGHLFNLSDAKWKNLRVKLTPTFTSGKMKMMFHTLAACADGLKELLDESVTAGGALDVRDILGRFGTDVISSVAFGIECNSMKDPSVEFRYYGKKAGDIDLRDNIKMFMQVMLPDWFLNAIRHKFTKPDVEKFFLEAIRETVEYREKNKIYRKDFMHLLLQLKNRGTVTDDTEITDATGESKEVALTLNQLAAQAYVFFMGGFETSSTAVTLGLYELALNADVQDNLREEINTVFAKHNNELTYAAVMDMVYMDKVMQEILRKYPPLPVLTRESAKEYIVPDSAVHLQKGTLVVIPLCAIQRDPEYYPNPDAFDPERFSEENKKTRPAFTYFPFGEGPRFCIGNRFGLLQSKVALMVFVKNYVIKLNKRTKIPLQFDPRAFMWRAKEGVWLDLDKLN